MKIAPGPAGDLMLGSLRPFKANPINFLAQSSKEHGDIVRFRFGHMTAHLLNNPDDIEHALSRQSDHFDKNTRSASRIAATCGASLLSSDQKTWERHRQLIQPAFQPSALQGIEATVDQFLTPMFDKWESHKKSGQPVDLVVEMTDLVIAATIKILFSSNIDVDEFNSSLAIVLKDTWRRIEAVFDLSVLGGVFYKSEFRSAKDKIDGILENIIASRRSDATPYNDVLSKLLSAHSDSTGAGLSDQELRDAAVTLLLAGHETTANALAWTFYLASGGHEGARPENLFAETIRLYPSIWIIERRAKMSVEIGGYDIPKGSSVLISPFLIHRSAAYWPEPNVFDPSRHDAHQTTTRPRHAYIPFGLGPHRCVGVYLARTIAHHVIKQVYARFRLDPVGPKPSQPHACLTLQHTDPIMMKITSV